MVRVGINGFGRIGRLVFRASLELPNIDVVAINDLANVDLLAHLLKYDSIHKMLDKKIFSNEKYIYVDDHKIRVFSVKNPSEIPWDSEDVDVVIESTGIFRDRASASLHMERGVDYVVVSAPMKDPDIMILPLLNEDRFDASDHRVISMGSCTTNALAPVLKVLKDSFGIVKGHMTTIHAYTNDQRLLDAIHKDLRRARAAALNIVPTSTGAAKAIFKVFPELEGKLNAIAVRVPVPDGSLIDLNVVLDRDATREEVNEVFYEASQSELGEILYYLDEPVVSGDIIGLPYLSIYDSLLTEVVDGNMVKIISWYDNEYGYSYHLAKLVSRLFG
jgi:glyceraldehyde 3-phosphate dehydrogenase